jgi:uncharacterized protein YbjT (DUF2867 family)
MHEKWPSNGTRFPYHSGGRLVMTEFDAVTGAFSYTGSYIARRLVAEGRRVRTLTGHPTRPHEFAPGRVEAVPHNFENPAALMRSLEGATTLYNTYWVRFPRGGDSFERAIANTRIMLRAAEQAGVRRFVHISVTNPTEDSPLPYYHGKALVEKAIAESKLSYAIIRPTVIFGIEDILINNMAWLIRHWRVFAVPGSGEYRLQPVFAEEVAEIAITAAARDENLVLDAAGPDTFTFNELVGVIARALGQHVRLLHMSPSAVLFLLRLMGIAVRDVILTHEEIAGLMAGLLVSNQPPWGRVRIADWLKENAARVGAGYASELDRHFRGR